LVAVAVTSSSRNVITSARVDFTWPVANAARVERTNAVVHVVTNAIGIGVSRTVTATYTEGVQLVAVAVASSFGDVRASAFQHCARTVANSTSIQRSHAIIHVVANAIGIGVCRTITSACTEGVQLVAVAVAISCGDLGTSARVDFTWPVADAACVKCAYAIVDIVANAIGIGVSRTIATACTECVQLVAVAVTISCGDVGTSARVNFTWAIADTARVERTNAVVHIVANAIGIGVSGAIAATYTEGIFVDAIAIAIVVLFSIGA